jgi:hypothetical protein
MGTRWLSVATSLVAVACVDIAPVSDGAGGSGGSSGADAASDAHTLEDGALCWSDQKWCGSCVDTTDPSYGCGSAGCDPCQVANATPKCESGQCSVGTCAAGHADCNDSASDGCETSIDTDHDHCGSCTKACTSNQVCLAGSCVSNCGSLTNCSGSCVDVLTDSQHCGSCTNPCTGGKTCQSGSCECSGGLTGCGATCVDTKTSKQNCGGCGNACVDPANGVAACAAGQCVVACFSGFTSCGGQCVDTATSTTHCGGCNKACKSGESCQNSLCLATYHAAADFSSVQGQGGWSYLNGDGSPMTYDAAHTWWQGSEQYLLLGNVGGHPGEKLAAMRRWTAPKAGSVKITGNAHDTQFGCGADGVNVSIRIGASVLWQATVAKDDTVGSSFDVSATVAVGDKIDFLIDKGIDSGCDSTWFDPTIVLSYKLP